MKIFLFTLLVAFNLAVLAQDVSVVQVEYFFDADNGVGKNTLLNVTPAADGTFPFTADGSGLSVGYHQLYIRTKDSNGKWSFITRRNVEVFAHDTKTSIISGEYFIDTDPGYGAAFPITVAAPDSVVLQNFTAAASGLPVGYHKLYGRMKDNLGRWGLTFRRNIEVYKNDTNYVYNAEYFFKTDNGYGNCTEVKLANPAVDGTFSFTVPLNQNPTGTDTLFLRVRDSTEGKWSITAIINPAIVLPLTLVSFDVVKENNMAQLTWQTANEISTAFFDVQRSTDGRTFTTVGHVIAKNNPDSNDYRLTNDISQLQAGKIFYRLKMADKDGRMNYSMIKFVDITSVMKIAVIPNPVIGNNVVFNVYSPGNARLQLMIYNNESRLIRNEQFSVQKGSSNKIINFSTLAAGSYFVRVTDGTSVQTVKFIKL